MIDYNASMFLFIACTTLPSSTGPEASDAAAEPTRSWPLAHFFGNGDPGEDDPGEEDIEPFEPLPELPALGERRCADFEPSTTYPAEDWGPHPVGVRTVELIDPLRPDRPLLTEIWYPAAEGTTGEGESYGMGSEELSALAGDDWAWLMALFGGDEDIMTLVETIAVRDAAEAEHDPTRGLVVFSHGYRGVRYQSTFLTTYLASHGYIVAAPDHVGNTMFDGTATDDEAVADRMLDMVFLSEELQQSLDVDEDRVAWVGHSFGASTVLMAGAMDNTEMVGISLAPAFDERMAGVYGPESYELRSALLVLGGTEDGTCPIEQQELAWERTVAPRYIGELDGMRHFDFTDLCANPLFAYGITSFVDQLNDACGEDPTAYHASVQVLSTSTLNRYLACDDSVDLASLSTDQLAAWQGDDASANDEASPSPKRWPTLPEATGSLLGWPTFGEDTPDVVFVGGLVDASVFADVIGDLDAVLVDDPDALDAVLAELDAPVVVALDAGGRTALASSESMSGLVLVGTSPARNADLLSRPDFNGGHTLSHSRHLALGNWDAIAKDIGLADSAELEAHLVVLDDDDVLDVLPEVPVLIIHGEHDDAVLVESARYLVDTLPDAQLALFQRSGHLPMLDEPELFALRLAEFRDAAR